MPAAAASVLTDAIIKAVEESGGSAEILSRTNQNPRKLAVKSDGEAFSLYAYVWTLTFGGRPALPDEYRIQMTGVMSPLALNPSGKTCILGYDPSLEILAGFDVMRHRLFSTGSPSVQIDMNVLREAITNGISIDRKGNGEIACGIRPDFFLTYIRTSNEVHRYGDLNLPVFKEAVNGRLPAQGVLSRLSLPRQKVVREVASLSRSASFRRLVLQAYDYRCAITGMQLRLVDAAHIIPVGMPRSTDEICNGLALTPTYHRAYDRGLIYLEEDYSFRLNEKKSQELREHNLSNGLSDLCAYLDRKMILPANREMWPKVDYIRQAKAIRNTA